jgi:hypothetical protein
VSPSYSVDRDALTVAMAVAPGVYARNRLFGFHKDPEVRRAKARAAIVRGLVRQLSGLQGATSGLVIERAHGRAVVRYRVDSLHLERRAELSEVEVACLLYLAARSGAQGACRELAPTPEDRALLHEALRRLSAGFAELGPRRDSKERGLGELLEEV